MHTAFTVTDIKLHINISFEYFWFLSRWHLTHKYIKPDWLITASHLRHLSYYKNMLKETWRLLFKTLLLKILVAWLLCIANVALRWVKYMNKAPFTLVEFASGSSRSADPRWARGWQVHDHSAVAERIRPTVLYGLSNRNKQTACPFPSDCHLIQSARRMGNGSARILAGVNGHWTLVR